MQLVEWLQSTTERTNTKYNWSNKYKVQLVNKYTEEIGQQTRSTTRQPNTNRQCNQGKWFEPSHRSKASTEWFLQSVHFWATIVYVKGDFVHCSLPFSAQCCAGVTPLFIIAFHWKKSEQSQFLNEPIIVSIEDNKDKVTHRDIICHRFSSHSSPRLSANAMVCLLRWVGCDCFHLDLLRTGHDSDLRTFSYALRAPEDGFSSYLLLYSSLGRCITPLG